VRSLVVLLTLAAAGCYSPSLQPCQLACANNACPDGLSCNAQNLCAMTPTATCADLPFDAPVDGTGANNVTIEVRDRMGGPLAAALVVFADAAGAQIAEVPTGLDGLAMAALPAGGSATVIRTINRMGTGSDLNVTTFLDLWPGAHVITQAEIDQRVRTVSVTFNAPTSTAQFRVYTSCTDMRSGTSPVLMAVPERCPVFDVFVTAAPATNPTPTHAAFLAAQSGSIVNLPLSAFQTVDMRSGTLTGMPMNATTLAYSLGGWVTPTLPSPAAPFSTPAIGVGSLVGPAMVPRGSGVATQLTLSHQPGGSGPTLRQVVHDRFASTVANLDRNYTGAVLPWLGNPTFAVTTRKLSWAPVAPTGITAGAPSFFAAVAQYSRDANSGVIWRVVGAASRITTIGAQQEITFPNVPGDRTFEPIPTDTVTLDAISLFQVEPQAEHDMIQILEPSGPDIGYFKIPTLRHLSVSIGQ